MINKDPVIETLTSYIVLAGVAIGIAAVVMFLVQS